MHRANMKIPKKVLCMNLGTTSLRGGPRNRWQDEVREDGRIVGGEGWQEKVRNREEWKKFLRMARNRHILHVPMEWMNKWIPDSGAPIIWCPKVVWEQHLSFGVVTVVIGKVHIWDVMLWCWVSGSLWFERSQCLHLWGQAAIVENCLTPKMKAPSYPEMLITVVQWQCHILEDQNFGHILVTVLFP